MTETQIVCIYHSPCNDGFTAAWIVHNYFKDKGESVLLYPTTYGKEPPLEICKGKIVYVVDFSYKPFPHQQLADVAEEVIVIDHHKTALILLDSSQVDNVELNINLNYSGAALTWQYFYPHDPIPKIVQYVEDRDMWWKRLPHCDDIHYALSSYEPDIAIWDILATRLEGITEYIAMCEEGAAIQRYNASWIISHLVSATREVLLAGYLVPSINIPGIFTSDAVGVLAKNRPFAIAWYDTQTLRKYSLRSNKDYPHAIDVSEIAKVYGGGGHKHAAGFELSLDSIIVW